MPSPKTGQPHWDRHAIKAEIHRRGTTLSALALANGLGESSCRVALVRSCPSADRVIARFLGISLHVLWPDRYDENGGRLTSQANSSKATNGRDSKKRRAV